jgi:hypothetical protein
VSRRKWSTLRVAVGALLQEAEMRLPLLVGTAVLAFLAAVQLSSDVRAALVLDQEYLVHTNLFAGFSDASFFDFRRAETFTVGVAGTLTEVDIFVDRNIPFTGFNILFTSAGVPTTSVAATGSLLSQTGGVAAFSVSLPVSLGEVLAIEPVITGELFLSWLAASPGTYAGGGDFFVNPIDGVKNFTPSGAAEDFRTFVTVAAAAPEPASLACLITGLAILFLLRRHRRSRPATPYGRDP